MINSVVFLDENLTKFEENFLDILRNTEEFQSAKIIRSPRAVGDLVQDIAGEKLDTCFPAGIIQNFTSNFGRRAMADMAFSDINNNYFMIDVKTHNKSTKFNMPNLTSVERLSKFYQNDKNFFVILLVEYHIDGTNLIFDSAKLLPIEHFCWDCLNIGALGWGQIQIKNANILHIDSNQTRKDWMILLCDKLDIFYPKEIQKIQRRFDYFEQVRIFWNKK